VTYEYDYADRLVRVTGLDPGIGSVGLLASYTYDALGRRTSKKKPPTPKDTHKEYTGHVSLLK
jgi:hypothetical protein